jgi:hypothetical protein
MNVAGLGTMMVASMGLAVNGEACHPMTSSLYGATAD